MKRVGEKSANVAIDNNTATVIDRLVDNLAAGSGIILRTLAFNAAAVSAKHYGSVWITDGVTTVQLHGFPENHSSPSYPDEVLIPPGWSLVVRGSRTIGAAAVNVSATWDDVV
jgi:hypothetical protein